MSDLVDVVADAAKLGEHHRVHSPVCRAAAHIDLALQHQPFAQTRYGQPQLSGLADAQRVVLVGHADADHTVARSLRVCPASRHVNASLG